MYGNLICRLIQIVMDSRQQVTASPSASATAPTNIVCTNIAVVYSLCAVHSNNHKTFLFCSLTAILTAEQLCMVLDDDDHHC